MDFIKKRINKFLEILTEEPLIKFDYKVLVLLGSCLVFFIVLTAMKFHTSSISYWNNIVPGNNPKESLIYGEAKGIRSDEWLVQTPFVLSQVNQEPKFKLDNQSLGSGNVPLLTNLPSDHFTMIFKPQYWGFLVFGPEHGFSFYWNMKIFGLFVGFFLLLMILTRSNFWISLFGGIWLYFSSFTQWWFSTGLPEMFTYFSLIFVFLAYLLLTERKKVMLVSSVLLLMSGINFILLFYPPFQVPLVLLLLVLIVGFLLRESNFDFIKSHLKIRMVFLVGVALIAGVVLFLTYLDAKDTIKTVMETAYPGKRVSVSGELPVAKYFSGFYNIFMDQVKVPLTPIFANICESSNFVLIYPLVILGAILAYFFNKRKIDLLTAGLIGYIMFISAWILVKMPDIIGKISLMSFSPAKRSFVGLGLACIILVAVYLGDKENFVLSKKKKVFLIIGILISIFVFGALMYLGFNFNQITADFLKLKKILVAAVFIALLSYLFIRGKRLAFCLLFLAYIIYPTLTVNPIAKGLGAIFNNDISKKAVELSDGNDRWIVFGNGLYGNYFKASGLNVFNGVKYSPDMEAYKVLDSDGNDVLKYNRYAHVTAVESGKTEAEFTLLQEDAISLAISPCSERLKTIGINKFIFTYQPALANTQCLKPLTNNPINGIWFFERK